ncbi:DUF4157 domain-containing protein [Streptomyces sp. NPDC001642]|uniref:eCIS core domain-containing protein n=1 Tax=Streptomyces sp. NPDC001642 TaxID=3154392 RepID=UPI003330095A
MQRASVVDAVGSPGGPLEPRILPRAEQAYSMDFGPVRVHNGPVAQRSAEELGALAYTTGSHIVLGGGSVADEVMFEEVDHIRQQALGPVPGTDNGRGEKVSHPDDPFERSAGANGRRLPGAVPPTCRCRARPRPAGRCSAVWTRRSPSGGPTGRARPRPRPGPRCPRRLGPLPRPSPGWRG